MSNSGQQQRSPFVEAHAVAHAALQQHMAQQAAQARLTGSGPPAAPQPSNPTFTLPDDGLGYDDGVRVLRSIGTWCVQNLVSERGGGSTFLAETLVDRFLIKASPSANVCVSFHD